MIIFMVLHTIFNFKYKIDVMYTLTSTNVLHIMYTCKIIYKKKLIY